MTNIFITQEEANSDSINGKWTYTNVKEIIPKNSVKKPLDKNIWQKKYTTEWRWRFLQLTKDEHNLSVEISYVTGKNKKRIYLNHDGQWVERNIPKEYDQFVKKCYYYYTSE